MTLLCGLRSGWMAPRMLVGPVGLEPTTNSFSLNN
jgi:hypothetical protein